MQSSVKKTLTVKNFITFPTSGGFFKVFCYGLGTLPLGIICLCSFFFLSIGVMYPDASLRPSKEDSIKIIHTAIDSGVRFIDTADVYCKNGLDLHYVEKIIKEALDSHIRGSEVIVATKVGMGRSNTDTSSRSWRPGYSFLKFFFQQKSSNLYSCILKVLSITGPSNPESIVKAMKASQEILGKYCRLFQLHHSKPRRTVDVIKAVLEDGNFESVGLCKPI